VANQQAVKWKRRKINVIAPEITQENLYSVFTVLIFRSYEQFSVIWLITILSVPSGVHDMNPVIISTGKF
jgi:hypothetical protein